MKAQTRLSQGLSKRDSCQPTYMDLLARVEPDHQYLADRLIKSARRRHKSIDAVWEFLASSIQKYFFKSRAEWIKSFPAQSRPEVTNKELRTRMAFCCSEIIISLHLAEQLDTWERSGSSHATFFLESLLNENAGQALLDFTSFNRHGDHMKGINIDDTAACFRALVTRKIADGLRKTGSLSTVLSTHSTSISEFAKQGDEAFFHSLANTIKSHKLGKLVLSFEQWLQEVWMPLALWQADPDAAVERLERYRELCIANGERVPRVQSTGGIKQSVRRFRNRLKQKRAD